MALRHKAKKSIVSTKQNQVTAEKNWNDLRTGVMEKKKCGLQHCLLEDLIVNLSAANVGNH